MSNKGKYQWMLLIAIIAFTVCGCDYRKKTNWNVTLFREDKIPYGSWLAYEALKYSFSGSRIVPLSRSHRLDMLDERMAYPQNDSVSLFLFTGLDFYLSEAEVTNLIRYASAGNEIFIFCSELDGRLARLLGCAKYGGNERVSINVHDPGRENTRAVYLRNDSSRRYGMQGRSLLGYFMINVPGNAPPDTLRDFIEKNAIPVQDEHETTVETRPELLGYSARGPNFLRFPVGKGNITLHAAPLVMSNYFLLQKDNRAYFEALWKTLPPNISTVYWNDYYIRSPERAGMGRLLKYPSMKYAFMLALFAVFMFVLFEIKRRQRIIPVIEGPVNSSVSFVETVGRLYYNKGDHHNLAEKMIQHFLEQVRSHYYLNTNELGEGFIYQLTVKSGQTEHTVKHLVEMIHEVRLRAVQIDEPYLFQLYQNIQQFSKNFTN